MAARDGFKKVALAASLSLGAADLFVMNHQLVPALLAQRAPKSGEVVEAAPRSATAPAPAAQPGARLAPRDEPTKAPAAAASIPTEPAAASIPTAPAAEPAPPPSAPAAGTPRVDSAPRVVYFQVGYAFVGEKARVELDLVVAELGRRPDLAVTLEGYADPQGSPLQAVWLRDARAKAVADYLLRQGVQEDRVKVERPTPSAAGQGAGGGGWANGRRVEIRLRSRGEG